VSFKTARPLAPRACQCLFCRKHNARTVTDPAGRAELRVRGAFPAEGYRFASKAADYVLCDRCGVYVGAWAEIAGKRYATLNLNAFDDPHRQLEAAAVSYEGETAAEKSERRAARWTPLE
jgi:hypothetical protein